MLRISWFLMLKQILISISSKLHIIYSATYLGCQFLPPPKYSHYSSRCSHIHTIDKLRQSLFLRCLYNYLWRHHCIHLLMYYSSIYTPFPGCQNVICYYYTLVPVQTILNNQSSISNILTSNVITHHIPPLYVLMSSWSLICKQIVIAISINYTT